MKVYTSCSYPHWSKKITFDMVLFSLQHISFPSTSTYLVELKKTFIDDSTHTILDSYQLSRCFLSWTTSSRRCLDCSHALNPLPWLRRRRSWQHTGGWLTVVAENSLHAQVLFWCGFEPVCPRHYHAHIYVFSLGSVCDPLHIINRYSERGAHSARADPGYFAGNRQNTEASVS